MKFELTEDEVFEFKNWREKLKLEGIKTEHFKFSFTQYMDQLQIDIEAVKYVAMTNTVAEVIIKNLKMIRC